MKNSKKHRTTSYSLDFREKSLELLKAHTFRAVSALLGIGISTLVRWKRRLSLEPLGYGRLSA